MIHRLVGRLFHLMVLLSQHLRLSVDPSEEFILNWCSSLCWHLLMTRLFPLSHHVHLWFASDTFILLSSNLVKDSSQCIRPPLPNNAINIKVETFKKASCKVFDVDMIFMWEYRQTKEFGNLWERKAINLIFPLFWWEWKISHGAKLAKAQSKCPRIAYGSKAFNLQAAAAKTVERLSIRLFLHDHVMHTAHTQLAFYVWITWGP